MILWCLSMLKNVKCYLCAQVWLRCAQVCLSMLSDVFMLRWTQACLRNGNDV